MWQDNKSYYGIDNVNCYTVAELGEMLPVSFMKVIEGNKEKAILKFNKYSNAMYQILYDFRKPAHCTHNLAVVENTEANARAKMLIYLLENKLITLKNE